MTIAPIFAERVDSPVKDLDWRRFSYSAVFSAFALSVGLYLWLRVDLALVLGAASALLTTSAVWGTLTATKNSPLPESLRALAAAAVCGVLFLIPLSFTDGAGSSALTFAWVSVPLALAVAGLTIGADKLLRDSAALRTALYIAAPVTLLAVRLLLAPLPFNLG